MTYNLNSNSFILCVTQPCSPPQTRSVTRRGRISLNGDLKYSKTLFFQKLIFLFTKGPNGAIEISSDSSSSTSGIGTHANRGNQGN